MPITTENLIQQGNSTIAYYSLTGQGLVTGTKGLTCYRPSVCQYILILCPGQISHKDRPNS